MRIFGRDNYSASQSAIMLSMVLRVLLYMSTLLLFMSWRKCVSRSVVSTLSMSSGLRNEVDVANALADVQFRGAKERKRFLSICSKQRIGGVYDGLKRW